MEFRHKGVNRFGLAVALIRRDGSAMKPVRATSPTEWSRGAELPFYTLSGLILPYLCTWFDRRIVGERICLKDGRCMGATVNRKGRHRGEGQHRGCMAGRTPCMDRVRRRGLQVVPACHACPVAVYPVMVSLRSKSAERVTHLAWSKVMSPCSQSCTRCWSRVCIP